MRTQRGDRSSAPKPTSQMTRRWPDACRCSLSRRQLMQSAGAGPAGARRWTRHSSVLGCRRARSGRASLLGRRPARRSTARSTPEIAADYAAVEPKRHASRSSACRRDRRLLPGDSRRHRRRQPARRHGHLGHSGLARRPRCALAARRSDGRVRARPGRELAGRGAGELPVRRSDLRAAGDCRHSTASGTTRTCSSRKGHPDRPREPAQDLGRAAGSSRRNSPSGMATCWCPPGSFPTTRTSAPTRCRSGRRSTAANSTTPRTRRYTIDAETEHRDDGLLRRLDRRGVQGRHRPGAAARRLGRRRHRAMGCRRVPGRQPGDAASRGAG